MKQIPENQRVYRIKTCYYTSRNGIHSRKDIILMSRLSDGYNWLLDEAQMTGADMVFNRITNLDQCEEGLYTVHSCNESRDWETGVIDDCDFVLVPFELKEPEPDEVPAFRNPKHP